LINGAMTVGIVVFYVRVFAPRFQRFPVRPRLVGDIDVPSLPAVAAQAGGAAAPGTPA
jgi:hypothetical protein